MIEEIRRKIQRQEYEYSLHAAEQSVLRRITRREVEEALECGAVIEDYPSDKYSPSCLVLGYTKSGRPLFSALIRSGLGLKSLPFMSPILESGLISRRGASNEL